MLVTGCPWLRKAFSRSSTSSSAFSRSAVPRHHRDCGAAIQAGLSAECSWAGAFFFQLYFKGCQLRTCKAMDSFLSSHRAKHSSLKAGKIFHVKPVEGCQTRAWVISPFRINSGICSEASPSPQCFLFVLFLLLHTGDTLATNV